MKKNDVLTKDSFRKSEKKFEKWKEKFAEKNGFYIPCIHDYLFYDELEKRKKSE